MNKMYQVAKMFLQGCSLLFILIFLNGCTGGGGGSEVDANGMFSTFSITIGSIPAGAVLQVNQTGTVLNKNLIDNSGGEITGGIIDNPIIDTPTIDTAIISNLCAEGTSFFIGKVCTADSTSGKKEVSGATEITFSAAGAQTILTIQTSAPVTDFSDVTVDLAFVPASNQMQFFTFLGFTGIDNDLASMTPSPSIYGSGTAGFSKLDGFQSALGASAGSAPVTNLSAELDPGDSTKILVKMNTDSAVTGELFFIVKGCVVDVDC